MDSFWISFCVTAALTTIGWFLTNRAEKDTSFVAEVGRASWKLLHAMAAGYPLEAGERVQSEGSAFLKSFADLYPCPRCGGEMKGYLRQNPPDLRGRIAFQRWLCEFHNDVNANLKKPIMSCASYS